MSAITHSAPLQQAALLAITIMVSFSALLKVMAVVPEPTGGFTISFDENGQLNFTTIPVVHCSGGGEGVAVNCEEPEQEITFRTP